MIQTLGDVFLLVAIISVGVVSFLFAVFLYHLIFVVMDLRQVMKRLNDLTAEIEDVLIKPVELVSQMVEWVQRHVWEAYFAEGGTSKQRGERKKKQKKRKKRERGEEGGVG